VRLPQWLAVQEHKRGEISMAPASSSGAESTFQPTGGGNSSGEESVSITPLIKTGLRHKPLWVNAGLLTKR